MEWIIDFVLITRAEHRSASRVVTWFRTVVIIIIITISKPPLVGYVRWSDCDPQSEWNAHDYAAHSSLAWHGWLVNAEICECGVWFCVCMCWSSWGEYIVVYLSGCACGDSVRSQNQFVQCLRALRCALLGDRHVRYVYKLVSNVYLYICVCACVSSVYVFVEHAQMIVRTKTHKCTPHHKTHQTFGQRAVMMIVVMWPHRWPPATINYQTPSIYLSETNPRHRAPVRSNTLWHHVRLLLPLKYNFYSTRKYWCGQMYSWARKNVTVCFQCDRSKSLSIEKH